MVKHYETPEEKEQYLNTIRQKSLKDVDVTAAKSRFALFNQPPPLAVGDNSYDHVYKCKKDDNGKPITLPRNPQTNPGKKGKIKSSYFSDVGYISIGDKYTDEYKMRMKKEMENKAKIPKDIPQFKYSNGYKLEIKALYEHKSDFKEVKKVIRDENGKVITLERNPQSGPIKNLYVYPKYMKDEYDRLQQSVTSDRLSHQAKVKDIAPFKSMDRERDHFSSLREIYYEDPSIKKKEKKELDLKSLKHDVVFKPSNPSKIGALRGIGKIPPYMADPIKDLVRKEQSEQKKDIFKLNRPKMLQGPTPSIVFNRVNMSSMISRSYR